ncbi:hypothetical protein [uncultured Brevibacillus sp.]|uniref:hypothetical protein n=1 Tax=uncultured Brevibacillus sp. TaxID=169970 RepID=UPI00259297EB|nr:hypothetical protein [uncultured Brevibacillus sp.]
MGKKLALSVLSTVVVVNMASVAMAKPPGPGFLVGGDVDKYYSSTAFLGDYFDEALDNMLDEMDDTLFVNGEGKVVKLMDGLFAATSEEIAAKTKKPVLSDFNGNVYKIVGEEGEELYNPATDPDVVFDGVGGNLFVENLTITGNTIVVDFSITIDSVTPYNFSIAGVNVVSASLDPEDKSKVVLTIDGAQSGHAYTLIAHGLQVYGEVRKDVAYEFTMTELGDLLDYSLRTADGTTYIIAVGGSSTMLVFELLDSKGNVVTTAGDVKVVFITTFGSFFDRRVTTKNGVATIMLVSESNYVPKAQIRATIVEAEDESLIGREATLELTVGVGVD